MAKKRRKKKQQENISVRLLWILFWLTVGILIVYYFRTEIKGAVSYIAARVEQVGNKGTYAGAAYKNLELPLPLKDRPEQIIVHKGYTVSYNKEWRLPNWVAYELIRDEVGGKESRTDKFIVDPYVDGICPTNADYRRSGFDRGHMAPAGDMTWDAKAMKESFYFSNMCPQAPGLNRGAWKELEENIRKWVIGDSAISIICGPLVNNSDHTIGPNRVKIPHAFFKVIVSPYITTPKGIGFVFKNDKENRPLTVYTVSIDSVETLTGMDFFSELPDELENRIESACKPEEWNF